MSNSILYISIKKHTSTLLGLERIQNDKTQHHAFGI